MSGTSPRPWSADRDDIADAAGEWVGGVWRDVDAAHIVRCVNAHDELVEALERLTETLIAFANPVVRAVTDFDQALSGPIEAARAAVAKAKGGAA